MIKLQKNIYLLYILLLPFIYMFPILNNIRITGINTSNSSFILLIGLILIFLDIFRKRQFKISFLIKYIFFMIIVMNISSIIMSTILYDKFGSLWGETTFRASIGDIIYYTFIGVIIFYNYYCSKLVTKKDIEKVFIIIAKILIVIGYIQILAFSNIPIISNLYNKVAEITGLLSNLNEISNYGRITITGTEPGSSSLFLGLLLLPYLFSKLIEGKREYNKYIILFLPIIYFTKSSTMYILFIINITIYLYFLIKKYKVHNKLAKKLLLLMAIIVITIAATIGISYYSNHNLQILKTINYFLVEKINDKDNLSTAMRMSVTINDTKCFLRYPVLGIGNGNQGFHYNEHIPEWIRSSGSMEVMDALNGEQKVVNGGPFLMAFLSGYGILGIVLLLIYIKKSNQKMKLKKEEMGFFYYMYYIAIISFAIGSIVGFSLIENNIGSFIISIPFFELKE